MVFLISTHFPRRCRNGLKARPWFLLEKQQRGFIGCPQSSPKPHWSPEGCGGQTSLTTSQKQHKPTLCSFIFIGALTLILGFSSLELLLSGNNRNILITQPPSKRFVLLKWAGDFISFMFICILFYSLNCAVTPVCHEPVLEVPNVDKGEEFLLAAGNANTQKFIMDIM